MINYLSKVLYVLTGRRIQLLFLLLIFGLTSILEAVGIGLIGPFLSLASQPESVQKIPMLNWLYQQLDLESTRDFIPILGLTIIIVFCLKSGFYFLARSYIFKFSFTQKSILISRLLSAYIKVPYTFYLSRNTASIMKNIITETTKFTLQCLLPILTGIANLVVIVFLLIVLAYTDLSLLVMILGIILPTFFLFQRLGKQFKKWGDTKSISQQEMIKVINHGLGGIKEMRVIGCERYFENQMKEQAENYSQAATLFQSAQLLPRILIETTLVVFLIAFLSLSFVFSQSNFENITAIMGVFAVAVVRLIPASSQFIQALGQIRNSTYALDMLYLDLKEIEKQTLTGSSLFTKSSLSQVIDPINQVMDFNEQIDLTNVSYRYPNVDEEAIKDISLTIKKGQSIALIGKSGAGKTTLVDVILGLLEPQNGDIRVDGISVYKDVRSWQNLIGYIPQSIFLTDDTVERNIAFGVPDELIDSQRIDQAIEAAQLVELIEQLPQGIKTKVGERGVRLSGGQRQRIGIARALYHQREILVLDEATSALDNETERLVSEAINSLAGTKTMIIIAHRLSTVENCDFVYMLEEGHVTKSGSYEEVVLQK
ncbi:MAG: ABC transporter ATP-binding protein [Spirulinaceae cyanobacterium]